MEFCTHYLSLPRYKKTANDKLNELKKQGDQKKPTQNKMIKFMT